MSRMTNKKLLASMLLAVFALGILHAAVPHAAHHDEAESGPTTPCWVCIAAGALLLAVAATLLNAGSGAHTRFAPSHELGFPSDVSATPCGLRAPPCVS